MEKTKPAPEKDQSKGEVPKVEGTSPQSDSEAKAEETKVTETKPTDTKPPKPKPMNLDDLEKRLIELEKMIQTLLRNVQQMKSRGSFLRQREVSMRMRISRDAMPPLDIPIKSMVEDGRRSCT